MKFRHALMQFQHSLHALLEHRVTPGLADDEIGPLHHDDAHKEGCVTCKLHNLPLFVCLGGARGDGKRVSPADKLWRKTVKLNKQTKQKNNTYPLLSIAVFQVVAAAVIPIETDAQKSTGQETIFSQDDKVGEEASQGLDHPCGSKYRDRLPFSLELC